MRLLITTQAVDENDRVLSFFLSWVRAFASHAEHVTVICLTEGNYQLPKNVEVLSLGKERGRSILTYVLRFYRYAWQKRNEYDAVFVHMNSEYAVLGGLLWRILGKRLVLWRNHKMPSLITRIGVFFAHAVCYTSPSSFTARYKKAVKMPIGIDTQQFKPGSPKPRSVLFLGRLDIVKNPATSLEALSLLEQEQVPLGAHLYGDPTPGRESYANELKEKYVHLHNLSFHHGVPYDATPEIYSAHDVYVNLTPSGSFDKTIGEAMAAGCVVVAANEVVRGVIPDAHVVDPNSPTSVAEGIKAALALDPRSRETLVRQQCEYVEREHSLALLTERLFGILTA